MFWLGLSLPICHWLGLSLAVEQGIAAHSLTGPWFAALLVLSFWLGWASPSLSGLWRGLAVGLGLSSAVAIAQAMGWQGIPSADRPAGLLYNSAIHGVAIALAMVALACAQDWRYVPAMLPGLWLAHSRGGWLIVALGAVCLAWGWRLALLALLAAAAVSLTWPGPSDMERFLIWRAALSGLDWDGRGMGSFADVLFRTDALYYPGHVHNDYLQLAFELGIGAVPVYLIYAATLARTESRYWPAFAGFALAGMFFFPLYTPITAFIGAALAGHVLRPGPSYALARA